jgi:uncharacterized protein YndB with AHSA1/START domain
MEKKLFTADFQINASKKMLYPYISSASGLAQWFCDDVNINEDKIYNFIWDDEDHLARLAGHRVNYSAKFEFLNENGHEDDDPSYFELILDFNELTETLFLRVHDYADFDDEREQYLLWEGLVNALKEIVGG